MVIFVYYYCLLMVVHKLSINNEMRNILYNKSNATITNNNNLDQCIAFKSHIKYLQNKSNWYLLLEKYETASNFATKSVKVYYFR